MIIPKNTLTIQNSEKFIYVDLDYTDRRMTLVNMMMRRAPLER